jgi:hypothetical protein
LFLHHFQYQRFWRPVLEFFHAYRQILNVKITQHIAVLPHHVMAVISGKHITYHLSFFLIISLRFPPPPTILTHTAPGTPRRVFVTRHVTSSVLAAVSSRILCWIFL